MAELLLQIIERAKTYQILKWNYHNPAAFNPYKLASKGYECTALNTLQCHMCHNQVIFTTNEGECRDESQITKQLQNHKPSCSYKDEQYRGYSRAELYLRMDQLIHSIKQSYKNSNDKLYPVVNMNKFREQLADKNQLEMLNSVMLKYKMDPKDHVRISFVLTVMGWQKKSIQVLQCAFCGRCINIKEFKTTAQDRQKFVDNEVLVQGEELFDPFDEHRYFCWWVHDQTGWQVYVQHLFDKLGEAEQLFRNQDAESILKIRSLLDVYLQKFKNIIGENFEKASKILVQCQQMAEQVEQQQEENIKMREQVVKRKKEMNKFLEQIESQVRAPLKRIKID